MATLLDWQPNTMYMLGAIAVNPNGDIVRNMSTHVSASSWAPDSGNWKLINNRMSYSNPTGAAGTAAGGSAPNPNIGGTATDLRGLILFGTGTAPAAGTDLVVVTFNTAFDATPFAVITPGNAATAALGLFVNTVNTSGFKIGSNVAPAASQAFNTYSVQYHVMS